MQNNYFTYQKLYRTGVSFNISEIVILNIKNNYFIYQKNKYLFWISKIIILDIRNSFLDI